MAGEPIFDLTEIQKRKYPSEAELQFLRITAARAVGPEGVALLEKAAAERGFENGRAEMKRLVVSKLRDALVYFGELES
jgi:hypothetical protein